MTNFVFCFCFLSSSLEKIQKEKGREETWERGNGFISSTRSLFLREETHKRVTRTNADATHHQPNGAFKHTFRAFETFLSLLLFFFFFTKQKKDTKENQFLRKINLSIGNHHERDDGKKPKRPTERATRTTNGPGRVREGEDNATLRAN